MNDEDVFLEQDVDLNYLAHFRQHAQKTRLHLQGLDPLSPLQPFYTESPTSYWTSAEKSAFFHALSIHSRLRPDLIAECVKTKNVVDICAYIDMLEDGARTEGGGVNRSEMDAAMEVSDKWIELEEEKATVIISHETKWEAEAAKIARDREIKVKKPPRAKKGEAKSAEERKRERVEFRLWRKEQRMQWNKEDIMRSMGVAHLKVIDNLLREEEETQAAAATSRQNTAEPPQPPLIPSDEEMIDPLLRSNPMPTPGPSTSTPSVEPESSAIPEILSPASRRRLQKRLYMRRKRAEATGRTELLPVEGSTVVQRGKPGRKSKPRKKRKTEEGDAVVDHDEEDDEEEDEEDPRHSHIGGKTLHYKIKGLLESTDMDAEALHKNGLGLFHLSALSKLMRMYNLLHDVGPDVSTEISADAVQFLHAHVVRYVTELIRRAIVSREQERDMKAHTKVWRFNSEQVIPATIDHAMQLAGTTSIGTKGSIIEGVFERLDVVSEEVVSDVDVSGEEDEQSAEDVALAGAGDQEIIAPTFNLHQGMYVPLVRLPGCSKEDYGYQRTSVEPEEPLLPSTTDEEALAAELRQEEELDMQDGIVAEKDENRLWGEYSRRSNRAAAVAPDHDEQDGDELRFKAPGLDGHVKSQVYVIDSDTE